jgi:hypothetical protein
MPPNVKLETVFVDTVKRFSLDVDETSGRTFVSIPVANRMVEYLESYEVDRATFDEFKTDPTRAHDFVAKAKRRELDHLLLFQPGSDRGSPE